MINELFSILFFGLSFKNVIGSWTHTRHVPVSPCVSTMPLRSLQGRKCPAGLTGAWRGRNRGDSGEVGPLCRVTLHKHLVRIWGAHMFPSVGHTHNDMVHRITLGAPHGSHKLHCLCGWGRQVANEGSRWCVRLQRLQGLRQVRQHSPVGGSHSWVSAECRWECEPESLHFSENLETRLSVCKQMWMHAHEKHLDF